MMTELEKLFQAEAEEASLRLNLVRQYVAEYANRDDLECLRFEVIDEFHFIEFLGCLLKGCKSMK